MTTTSISLPHRGQAGLFLLCASVFLAGFCGTARAQVPPIPRQDPLLAEPQPDLNRAPIIPPDVLAQPGAASASPSSAQANRIRLFRIQPGFLSDPPGLDSDDKTPADNRMPDPEPDNGPDWLTVAVGNDNPFLDFRRPNDPGGVGFTKITSQVALFDTNKTACSIGLQAVTPAGLAADGLPDRLGTTVVTPAVSLFHTLNDDATAVQLFVGKHVPLMNSGPQSINRDLQYGLALQRPVSTDVNDPFRCVYLSVGALGLMKLNDATTVRTPVQWEVLPGLHYKMADNWWISGALVLPVGRDTNTASTLQQWQLTCSFQF
jgi:hypothetical protein